jgi:8-oxo-dGTP diphosphatase
MASGRRQRVAAYLLTFDEQGQVLLVLAGPGGRHRWFLPGGGVRFGEHPADAVRREVKEETGQDVATLTLNTVVSDTGGVDGAELHSVRVIYRGSVVPGRQLRHEVAGSTVGAHWVPTDEAFGLDLAPFVRGCLTDWRGANRLGDDFA